MSSSEDSFPLQDEDEEVVTTPPDPEQGLDSSTGLAKGYVVDDQGLTEEEREEIKRQGREEVLSSAVQATEVFAWGAKCIPSATRIR